MFPAIGLVVLLVMVFGGFVFTGGALGPVMEAIPHELIIIGGAVAGALIIGNSGKELKALGGGLRSEEHTSELQSLMRISYAVFCLKKKNTITIHNTPHTHQTPH